jgi:hypothetical protein
MSGINDYGGLEVKPKFSSDLHRCRIYIPIMLDHPQNVMKYEYTERSIDEDIK